MKETETVAITPKEFFSSMTVLHLAMFTGATFICLIFWYLAKFTTEISTSFSEDILLYIIPILAVSAPYLGSFLYKKRMLEITDDTSLTAKLLAVRSAQILRMACIEGPILVCAIVFFETNNFLYLIFAGILIAYFFTLRPIKRNIIESMDLTTEQKIQMTSEHSKIV